MADISYARDESTSWTIYLEGKKCGRIFKTSKGFQYRPKGFYSDKKKSFHGEYFPCFVSCISSLGDEA
jgi:hypothetical protein